MSNKQTTTLTLDAELVAGLNAMVELGCADRRDFLNRYAAENEYTDEQIAQGHYEADCAEQAIIQINDALAATDNQLAD